MLRIIKLTFGWISLFFSFLAMLRTGVETSKNFVDLKNDWRGEKTK